MDRHAIALVLDEISTLLALSGGNRFAVRAYRNAARALDALEGDAATLYRSGELADVPGIGSASLAVVRDLIEHGESRLHERLKDETPSGMVEMLALPGIGATRIAKLHQELGVDSLDDLEAAAREGRIAAVRGFGPKTQQSILDGIEYVRGLAGRRLLLHADEAAYRLCRALGADPRVLRVTVAGEIRRRCETAEAVELVVAADAPADAARAVAGLPALREARVEEDGDERRVHARLSDGFVVRAHCVAPADFGPRLFVATGSDAHVRALLDLARAGGASSSGEPGVADTAEQAGAPEQADGAIPDDDTDRPWDDRGVYRAVGLGPVPPELREGLDELERARDGRLPRLVRYSEVRGCFHNHTDASDGKATLVEMAQAAMERGWRYLGIADHSKSAFYAGGLDAEMVRRQHEAIDRWNDEHGDELRLLKGIEADVLADGRVDFHDEPDVLDAMDFVVASVHSGFRMSRADMTRRMVRAVSDPSVRILGHATGRLLLHRQGYDVDLDAVLAAAAENETAVELNADPRRLDMDWRWWRRARELGVRCAINPDAHSVRGLDNVRMGVDQARKGWLEADDVLNTWELERLMEWLGRRTTTGRNST